MLEIIAILLASGCALCGAPDIGLNMLEIIAILLAIALIVSMVYAQVYAQNLKQKHKEDCNAFSEYVRGEYQKIMDDQEREYKARISNLEEQVMAVQTKENKLLEECRLLRTDNYRYVRNLWFYELRNNSYQSEIDVEVKVVYPMLKYLGYLDKDVGLREQITIQVGRQQTRVEADWVVWGTKAMKRALFIVEAKTPTQLLDDSVQGQARSYAFGLNCQLYVLTNGHEVQIYRRGVERDECLCNFKLKEIQTHWTTLFNTLGHASLVTTTTTNKV
ncbi:MAG: type I restriction enzyme HsdR N-terminal domain-containing protein [Caldilineaceae bacterium]